MKNYKVEMVDKTGTTVGVCAVQADSPCAAMTAAEDKYPRFAAYTASILGAFDYSTVGGMMAAN